MSALPAFSADQPDLVLIPGFMCDQRLWQCVLPALQSMGRVHCMPAHQHDSIEACAAAVAEQIPDNAVVIGFSLGGYVARHLAARWPHKVQRLFLLNSSARATTGEEIARAQQQMKALEVYPYRGQTRTALLRALHPQRPDPRWIDCMLAMSVDLGITTFRQQMAIVRADGHAELAALQCPVHIIASADDQMRTVQEAERMAAAALGSTLDILPDCGHMSVFEQPENVTRLLQYHLTTLPAGKF